jgi:hypothetical protein
VQKRSLRCLEEGRSVALKRVANHGTACYRDFLLPRRTYPARKFQFEVSHKQSPCTSPPAAVEENPKFRFTGRRNQAGWYNVLRYYFRRYPARQGQVSLRCCFMRRCKQAAFESDALLAGACPGGTWFRLTSGLAHRSAKPVSRCPSR